MSSKDRKINLFSFITDLSSDKRYILEEGTQTEYLPFMINKAFSQHIDTILLANEMNKRPNIPKEWHHDFLFYSVEPKSRYGKWAKKEEQDNAEVIAYLKDKYKIGNDRALEYYDMLSNDEIIKITKKLKTLRGKI